MKKKNLGRLPKFSDGCPKSAAQSAAYAAWAPTPLLRAMLPICFALAAASALSRWLLAHWRLMSRGRAISEYELDFIAPQGAMKEPFVIALSVWVQNKKFGGYYHWVARDYFKARLQLMAYREGRWVVNATGWPETAYWVPHTLHSR